MENIEIKSNLYNYEIEFINDFGGKLNFLNQKYNCTFVIDKNIYDLYHDAFKNIKSIYFIDAVEQKKNMDTIMDLVAFWKENKIKKNHKVICIGGGITQDIVSFTSDIYLRNIDWYFFPTTLLAMCDSCIGGKCGINYLEYKNQLGVFYPPKQIFIDTGFLTTLSQDDYINGWGELLKFSLTQEKTFFDEVNGLAEHIPCSTIEYFIRKGLLVKKAVIEKDEFEGDLRRVLNYGHTFGHALETYTKNKIPHGTAVIWGIDVVNYIAMRENILPADIYLKIKNLIKRAFLKSEIKITEQKLIIDIIRSDKKVKDDTVYFAFLEKLSSLIIYPMKIDNMLLELFDDYLRGTHEYYNN
jgi:3-dehydroquinate synthase